ncbi:MAG: hypothetical protein U0R65_02265 [Candidatus Nanopelagicales bacterium]
MALAATDPANAYGAALPWPAVGVDIGHFGLGKAGAAVVLVDGTLALYLERGGRHCWHSTSTSAPAMPRWPRCRPQPA